MKNKKIPVIFLVGANYSGSTLLDVIFDTHSEVVGVGELLQYPIAVSKNYPCSCDKKLNDCQFWQNVFKKINPRTRLGISRNKTDFLLDKDNYFYCYGKQREPVDLPAWLEKMEQIYKSILIQSNKEFVFDSSKDPLIGEALLKSNKLDIVLVHLVRDGRGSVSSFKNIHPEVELSLMDRLGIMYRWLVVNLKMEVIKRRYPDKCFYLSYENFVRNPEELLKKLINELGINFERSMLKFDEKIHHQAGGNIGVRFINKKGRKSKIKEDLRWKKESPLIDRFLFNLFFGWLNLYYQRIKK